MKNRAMLFCIIFILLLIGLSSCAGADKPSLSIENPWGRLSPTTPTAGGMYMVIKNTGKADDTLLGGKSPACGSIEVHKMVKRSDGTMGMDLVDKPLVIPAGGQVELKVGGLHIMCIMINTDMYKVGGKIDLTLQFEKSGEKSVSAEIRSE